MAKAKRKPARARSTCRSCGMALVRRDDLRWVHVVGHRETCPPGRGRDRRLAQPSAVRVFRDGWR